MDPAQVQEWLDSYVEAWRTYDPAEIGALFTDDAEYRSNPWAEPIKGRDAIVEAWLAHPDEPSSWKAEYHPVAVDGTTAVAEGRTTYLPDQVFVNLWVLEFGPDGRCSSYTDWYMEVPASERPA